MSIRPITQVIRGLPTSDGAGVKLYRSLGQTQGIRLDPFLMLDEFGTENPDDYIAGFPPHPHRGFETVTYMLEGHMLHEDHMGNRGDLHPGDVQWMTAGRGIIHSEMPQQKEGAMRGFQLWLNLPAKEKMKPASYRDIPSQSIPQATDARGIWMKVIAGEVEHGQQLLKGPMQGLSTDPLYLDLHIPKGESLELPINSSRAAFSYVYEGLAEYRTPHHSQTIGPQHAVIFGEGETIAVTALEDLRCLILAAIPIQEPIVQYGPFVMNTREEIEQAIDDYQNQRLTA